MKEDELNNLYFVGTCAQNDAFFNGTNIEMTQDYNFYLVKYDQDGNYLWNNFVDEITCSQTDIAIVSPEEIYLSVTLLSGTYFFDDLPVTINEYLHYVIAKISGEGQFEWVRTVSRNEEPSGGIDMHRNSFMSTEGQYIYLTGNAQGNIIWNNDSSMLYSRRSPFVAQLDLEGNVIWVKSATNISLIASVQQMTQSVNNDIFFSGIGKGSMEFDDHQINESGWYAWMARLLPYNSPTAVGEVKAEKWSINYNNVTSLLHIFINKKPNTNAQLKVIDAQGRLLKALELGSGQQFSIQLHELPKGIYLVNINNRQRVETKKFVTF